MADMPIADGQEPQGTDPTTQTEQTAVPRGADRERVSQPRAALVDYWNGCISAAKEHWKDRFHQMNEDRRFARGRQWPDDTENLMYVTNVTLRHLKSRTAALYAKRPTTVARLRKQVEYTAWDGNQQSLQMAFQMVMQAQAMAAQFPGQASPQAMPGVQDAMAIVQDYEQARQAKAAKTRFAETLEITYDYQLDEQPLSFKTGMKLMVRRALTTGIGYVKLGFVRATEVRPELTERENTLAERLAQIERLAEDLQDGEFDESDAEAEELRLQLRQIQEEPEQIVREGITLDYPRSDQVLIDPACQALPNFLGADWVAQEFILTVDKVQEIYGVDVSGSYKHYEPATPPARGSTIWVPDHVENERKEKTGEALACVYEIWHKAGGEVMTICDGYPDFLREPEAPPVWTERFWPFFALVPNDVDDPQELFPPSDVELIRHQQQEINRARQGLREHRIANRPKMAVAAGMLDDEDKDKLEFHPANAVLELSALAPGQKIDDVLQVVRLPGIDPNLYETNSIFEDILRTVGSQEANFGTTSDSTATESSIAEGSRMTDLGSVMDDFDTLLSELARASGQILMAEMSEETVRGIAGQGAVWPSLSRAQLAAEVALEVEAGSSGRPNQAAEVRNAQQIFPLLIQIPGISPEFLARELLKRLDDRLNIEDAFEQGLPSVAAMNSAGAGEASGVPPGAEAPAPGAEPTAQGPQGAANAPQAPPGPDNNAQAQFPAPGAAPGAMLPQ